MRTLVLALAVLALAGCTAVPAPLPTPEPIGIPTTCEQVMDVNSLQYNIQIAYQQDRLSGQEFVQAVATLRRMLSAVDVEPGTDLAASITVLGDSMTDTTSDAYYAAIAEVGDICIAGGFPNYGISVWTGG